MGYKLYFMDNLTYSAQDINEHFGRMFTSGVCLAESGNILSDLNELTSDIVTDGTAPDSCLVVKTDNGYKVLKGVAYMHDGSSISFDEDGYDFSLSEGKEQFVYLERDEQYNTIRVQVGDTQPTGEHVMLATIGEDGEITDCRQYAKLKLNSLQESTLKKFTLSYYRTSSEYDRSYDIGNANFSYFGIMESEFYINGGYRKLTTSGENFREIVDGESQTVHVIDSSGTSRLILEIVKNGSVFTTTHLASYGGDDYEINFVVV